MQDLAFFPTDCQVSEGNGYLLCLSPRFNTQLLADKADLVLRTCCSLHPVSLIRQFSPLFRESVDHGLGDVHIFHPVVLDPETRRLRIRPALEIPRDPLAVTPARIYSAEIVFLE